MVCNKRQRVAELLLDVEVQLRRLNYWQVTAPSIEALSSGLPFSCDTLTFPQWLQFIFLRKIHNLIECSAPLPTACAITPYAKEYFKRTDDGIQTLLAHLNEIDTLLTDL